MNFTETLSRHLDALSQRDLDIYMSTIHPDTITLIMPNGHIIHGYEAFQQFHGDWFSDPDWSIQHKLLNTHETSDMATALLSIQYDDLDQGGKPYQMTYYLNLIFQRTHNQWLLIFDQNTTFTAK